MMCFRDMTFCTFDKCIKWSGCYRALNEEQQALADLWWFRRGEIPEGEYAPIMAFTEEPECYENNTSTSK